MELGVQTLLYPDRYTVKYQRDLVDRYLERLFSSDQT